jgi:hypothetical protein
MVKEMKSGDSIIRVSALVSITPSLTVVLLPSYYCFAPAALLLAASAFGAL